MIKYLQGNCLEVLKGLKRESAHMKNEISGQYGR